MLRGAHHTLCGQWWPSVAAIATAAQAPRLLQALQWSLPLQPPLARGLSEGKIGADAGEVAELIEASIAPQRRSSSGSDDGQRPRVLTTRREALALYREVLRYTNLFVWRDAQGRPWRDVLRASTRAEFEAARHERDPELVNRMIVTGRDAVHQTVERFMAQRARILREEEQAAGFGDQGGEAGGGFGAGMAPRPPPTSF